MPSLHATAARLAAVGSVADLAALVASLGFDREPLPLDAGARATLELPDAVEEALVARGPGSARALILALAPHAPTRELLARVAARLSHRAPHRRWLLAAVEREGGHLALAAWPPDRHPPRLAALLVDRRHVAASDAETVRALAAAPASAGSAPGADLLLHTRWTEILGRDALGRRFYRTLERLVGELAASARGRATVAERGELALLHLSRLLFLSFLEAQGWLDGDAGFLARTFHECMATGGDYDRRVLRPLFFGTLNTPTRQRAPAARRFGRIPFLNGGLFAPTALDRRLRTLRFDDAALGALHSELLGRYRFTAREEHDGFSDAAVDPEMLGRAFEQLMAPPERRATGAFYTPQPLVAHLAHESLHRAVATRLHACDPTLDRTRCDTLVERALASEPPAPLEAPSLADALRSIAILDPACGSGAFLVHALERLAALLHLAGDPRPLGDLRRATLTRSIFGVDVNRTAVWLCELRLWLSVVTASDEPDPLRVPPLPNLDRNIRVGDTLAGAAFDATPLGGGPALATLRERYARASGARKISLARRLDADERSRALARLDRELDAAVAARRDVVAAARARDLFGERPRPSATTRALLAARRERVVALRRERRRIADGGALPFAFAIHFADVAARAGFDAIVGNPPWVRPHHLDADVRASHREGYLVHRAAAWDAGAALAGAGRGFAAQVDLAALFVERSLALLRPGGTLALLLPAKLWRTLAGGGVRRLLLDRARVERIEDWSDAPATFDAAVYPSVLVARRHAEQHRDDHPATVAADAAPTVSIAVHRRAAVPAWSLPLDALPFDCSPGSPWLLLPPDAARSFHALRAAGPPLARSLVGRPTLGVKSGCNDAFVVACEGESRGLARVVDAHGRHGVVEPWLLRPLLRGDAVRRHHATHPAARWILWPHDADGAPLDALPPHAADWLAPWRRRLERRADGRRRHRWWSLFRTDGATPDTPRVVWADMGRELHALVLDRGDTTVPLNSCYVARCPTLDDALALAALLRSPIAAAWLSALAEPARGGYSRFLGWTVSLLPLPRDWPRARAILAPVGALVADGSPHDARALLRAALDAYALRPADVRPLLAWHSLDRLRPTPAIHAMAARPHALAVAASAAIACDTMPR